MLARDDNPKKKTPRRSRRPVTGETDSLFSLHEDPLDPLQDSKDMNPPEEEVEDFPTSEMDETPEDLAATRAEGNVPNNPDFTDAEIDEQIERVRPVKIADATHTHILITPKLPHEEEAEKTDPLLYDKEDLSGGAGEEYLDPPSPTEFIGPFRIERVLGHGGMGIVYLAYDPRIDRKVALKILRPKHVKKVDSRKRFRDEIRVMGRLQHPGIIPVYHYDVDEKVQDFYTMRPVQGKQLKDILDGLKSRQPDYVQQYTTFRLLRIFLRICEIISYAHSQNVVHRDLKPANILVGDYGEVLVSDWGLALTLAPRPSTLQDTDEFFAENPPPEDQPSATGPASASLQAAADVFTEDEIERQLAKSSRVVIGTPCYMSPEQAMGRNDLVDRQTDIYGLGAILYEILTLTPPYQEKELGSLFSRILRMPLEAPELRAPDRHVPPDLSQACLRALAKHKSRRTPSVQELLHEIEHFIEGRPSWRMILDDDFRRRRTIPSHWAIVRGGWSVVGNTLATNTDSGENTCLISTRRGHPGDIRVEIEALVEKGCVGEIGIQLCGPTPGRGQPPDQGYLLAFGADHNLHSKLVRNGVDCVVNPSATAEPDRVYHLVATREEDMVRLRVDDKLVLEYRDFFPVSGEHCGLYCWGNGLRVRRARAWSRGITMQVNAMRIPDEFFNDGLFERAAALYARIAESHPGTEAGALATYKSGVAYLRQGKTVEAREHFTALAETEQAALTYLGFAQIAEREKNWQRELEALETGLARCQGRPNVDLLIGRLWERGERAWRRWRLEETLAFFGAAIKISPNDPRGLSVQIDRIGRVYSLLGRFQEARQLYQEIGANDNLDKVHRAWAKILEGQTWRFEGNWKKAREQFRLVESDLDSPKFQSAWAIRLIGQTYALEGRFEQAEEMFHRVLMQYPDEPGQKVQAIIGLGSVARLAGDFNRSEEILESILVDYAEQRGHSAWALREIGLNHLCAGRHVKARKSFATQFDLYKEQHQDNQVALFLSALSYYEEEKLPEMEAMIKTMLQNFGRHFLDIRVATDVLRGFAALKSDKPRTADAYFRRANTRDILSMPFTAFVYSVVDGPDAPDRLPLPAEELPGYYFLCGEYARLTGETRRARDFFTRCVEGTKILHAPYQYLARKRLLLETPGEEG